MHMTKKIPKKKHWNSENILGGGVVNPNHEKGNVSVGVNSTLLHPLAKASLAGLTDHVTRHNF